MGYLLTIAALVIIVAQALVFGVQLWLYLPRDWRTSPFGQIISFTVVALTGWFVAWLGLVLAIEFVRQYWGVTPRPLVRNAINVALIGSLILILAAANAAMWRWRRNGTRPRRAAPREGGIDDDD